MTGPDLQRTIEELAKELQGLDYRQAEQRMRLTYRLAWLRILEQSQRLVRDPGEAPRQLRTLFRSVSANMQQASTEARAWMKQFLPQAWQAGLKQSDMQFQKQGFNRPINASFSLVHRDAVEVIARDSMHDLLKATQLTEDRVKSKVRKLVKDEVEGLVATGQRATGKRIAERLAEDKIFGITASNGRFIPMEEYGRIVAHVKLREAHTKGVEQLIKDNGLDLVRISMHIHKPDCCTPLEGKVYSLSGNDTRFPKLPRHTPFHIGCRHVETPFVDSFFDEGDLAELRAQSKAQRPVEVYTPKELASADERRKQREQQREQQRLVEQQHEEDIARKKQTVAGAMKQEQHEVFASSHGGAKVKAPADFPESHFNVLAELVSSRKLRIAEDVTRNLTWPNTEESNSSLLRRLGGELSLLPESLLRFWNERLDDYLELVANDISTKYAAAFIPVENRAFVQTGTWIDNPGMALEETVHLLDHGLGVMGQSFSAGGGLNPKVQKLAQQVYSIYQNNPQAVGEYGATNSREFLAQAIRLYFSAEKEQLKNDSPEMFEFIEQVWSNEEKWTEALR